MELVSKQTEQDMIDRDDQFVQEYVANGGNATQAAIACGVSKGSAPTTGYRLKRKLSKAIQLEQMAIMESWAPRMLLNIKELAENAESENVRLKAASDLLDRSGWKPVIRQEVTETSRIESMTTEELEEELEKILRETGQKIVDA